MYNKHKVMTIKQKCKRVPSKSGIYKLTSPSGKIYIGQSINFKKRLQSYYNNHNHLQEQRRLYNSFQKYGVDRHKFDIIEYTELLDERELYWGEYYNVLGKNGLVCRLGHGKGKLSQETKDRISMSLKGNKQSKETVEKRRLKLIGREISDLERINKREGKLKQYQESPMNWGDKISKSKQNSNYKRTVETNRLTGDNNKKPILQYDKNMNLIKEYKSATDAMKETGIKNDNISHCLRGKSKSAGGFMWKYKKPKINLDN